jgi:hypothetical protein
VDEERGGSADGLFAADVGIQQISSMIRDMSSADDHEKLERPSFFELILSPVERADEGNTR